MVFRISLVDYEVKQIQKIPIWYEEYVDILEKYKSAVCAKCFVCFHSLFFLQWDLFSAMDRSLWK